MKDGNEIVAKVALLIMATPEFRLIVWHSGSNCVKLSRRKYYFIATEDNTQTFKSLEPGGEQFSLFTCIF